MNRTGKIPTGLAVLATALIVGACSGSGGGYRGDAPHGIGYGHYHGPGPWANYEGHVDIDPGPGMDDAPPALPLPEMGMPVVDGGMDMGMGLDMGGFD
jgi:hypothetical protein